MSWRNFLICLKQIVFFMFLSSQHVRSENQCTCLIKLTGVNNPIDLSGKLPVQENLDSIDSLTECEMNCRKESKKYLNFSNNLENMDLINFNINSVKESANILCKSIVGEELKSPGSNVNIKIKGKRNNKFIKDIFMGKLCCNQPCSCQIRSSNSILVDFKDQILKDKIRDESYNCNNEMKDCELKCRQLTGDYLSFDSFKNMSYSSDLDIFENNPSIGNFICEKENKQLVKPGLDYYVKVETQKVQVYTPKHIYLGKVCCKRPCDCRLVYNNQKSATDSASGVEMISLNSYLANTEPYYNCDDEKLNCMKECRKAAGVYLKNETLTNYDLPLSTLDLFINFDIATDMCKILFQVIEEPGFNIYLRYTTSYNNISSGQKFDSEDLHVGRMCCKSFFENFLPSNRCGAILIPG